MAASYVARNGNNSANTASTTLTFTTTRTIAAGEHLCVAAHAGGGGADPSSVVVGGLSLTKDFFSAVQTSISLWSAPVVSQIASGSTGTLTWAVGPTNRQAICFSLAGIATSSYVDVSKAGTFVDNQWTTGASASTSQADEIVVAMVGWRLAGSTPVTVPAGYTRIFEIDDPGGAVVYTDTAYRELTTTGVQTAAWTPTSGANGDVLLVTYKGATTLGQQVLVPDADITTTGWATAPLWSKLADSSDATLVTATAS